MVQLFALLALRVASGLRGEAQMVWRGFLRDSVNLGALSRGLTMLLAVVSCIQLHVAFGYSNHHRCASMWQPMQFLFLDS